MSEYKGTLEGNDIEWLEKIATGDAYDTMLSVGRTQRILNTLAADDYDAECLDRVRITLSENYRTAEEKLSIISNIVGAQVT